MKVIVFVKATQDTEAGVMPNHQELAAMDVYNDSLKKAGILRDCDGLKPTKFAKRVRFSGSERLVTDGPFTETKEIVAGYWIWEVASMEEAVEWVKKCPNPTRTDSDIDIRRMFSAEDFA